MFEATAKTLIVAGLLLAGVGLIIWFTPRIPFMGDLPGDVMYESNGTTIYIPITTCLVVSVLLTLIVNALLYLFGR